jgi:pyruvate/2-oxoacid:ferredoxin oxidoreductase beta subunit
MQIMAGHHIPYAATATVGFPDDLIKKVKKAKETRGFKFIHILAPCPTGWLFRSERSVEVSRLAVETNIFPLFEVEHGIQFIINREPSGVPVEEYLKIQSRYQHLASGQIDALQKEVDEKWNRLKWFTTYQNNKQ